MIPDDLQDQAALYALDALEADESARFEETMRENAELRAMFARCAMHRLGSPGPFHNRNHPRR
jgi:anti-sigma-K factor RskA